MMFYVSLFKILKDDALKGLHSICQLIWKTQQWPQDWQRSVFIPIPKKGNAKVCSNYISLCSHYMLARLCSKSFKLGFSSMWIKNFHMCNLGLKNRGTRDQIMNIRGSLRKQGNSRKTSTSASLTILKPLSMWTTTNCGKFFEMGVPDHLTCLLRNLNDAGQEATVRTGHEETDWFQIEKGVHQGCILSPCLLSLYAAYIMWNVGLARSQTGIEIAREIPTTSDMQMIPL